MPWIHWAKARSKSVGLVVAVVADLFGRPGDAPLGSELDRVGGQLGLVDDRRAGRDQLRVAADGGVDVLALHGLGERRLGGGHHERIAVVGAEMEDTTLGDEVHVLLLATEGPDREATADRLGQRDQVGLDAEVLGRTAVTGGQTGLHLVEDQQRAMPGS